MPKITKEGGPSYAEHVNVAPDGQEPEWVPADQTPPRWGELGARVKARRENQRLAQADLAARGGPGEITLRKIERGEVRSIRNATKAGLERALGFRTGYVDRVLAGTATEEDHTALALRSTASGRARARDSVVTLGQAAEENTARPLASGIAHERTLVDEIGIADSVRTTDSASRLEVAGGGRSLQPSVFAAAAELMDRLSRDIDATPNIEAALQALMAAMPDIMEQQRARRVLLESLADQSTPLEPGESARRDHEA